MGVKIDDDFTGGDEKSAGRPPSAASQLVELALDRYHFGVAEDGQPYAVKPGRHVVRMSAAERTHYAPNCRRRTTRNTRRPHRNRRSLTRCSSSRGWRRIKILIRFT
jgi:hypothetical protein